MNNILVTGSSGFVGCEVVKQLREAEKNVNVIGLDCVNPEENIPFIKADLTNYEDLKKSLKGKSFDCIMHIASIPIDTGDPFQMVRVNIIGCQNILEYARESKVERFLLASSISAYEWYPLTKFNPPDYMPVDENHPCRPKDYYSTTKRMQELLTMNYYYQYKLPITILRLTAVLGPNGKGGGSFYREFAKKLIEGKKVQIPHFSPEELCHYVDRRDIARMFIVAAQHPKAIGEIFNCCGERPTKGYEFENVVKDLVPGIEVEYGYPWSMAQGGELSFDMSKAEKLINFKPRYTFADSIRSIKEWAESGGLEEK